MGKPLDCASSLIVVRERAEDRYSTKSASARSPLNPPPDSAPCRPEVLTHTTVQLSVNRETVQKINLAFKQTQKARLTFVGQYWTRGESKTLVDETMDIDVA